MAQQYDGGQSVDLDLDKDFLMQAGDFQMQQEMDAIDADLGLDGLEYGADPELISAMNQGVPIASPAQPVSETAKEAKDRIKGKGLSAFTKGLQQGLGSFLNPEENKPEPAAERTTARQPAKAGMEVPQYAIPILIGAIGIAVVVFAMGKRKQNVNLA